jgi:predicted transposase YbfD/YdcC
MNLDKFEKIINEAFDIKEKINANSDKSIIRCNKRNYRINRSG